MQLHVHVFWILLMREGLYHHVCVTVCACMCVCVCVAVAMTVIILSHING